MIRFLPFLLLMFVLTVSNAQEGHKWFGTSEKAKEKEADHLLKQADSLQKINPDLAIADYLKAAAIRYHSTDFRGYAAIVMQISHLWMQQHKPDSALVYAAVSARMAQRTADTGLVCRAYDWLLYVQTITGQPSDLVATYRTIPAFVFSQSNKGWPAKIENHVANAYADLGMRDSAAIHYRNIISLLHEKDTMQSEMIAAAYNGLASLAIEANLFEEGFRYLDRAERLLQQKKAYDKELAIACMANRSLAHLQHHRYDSAIFYGNRALYLAEQHQATFYIPNIAFNIVSAYAGMNKPKDALRYSYKAYQAAQQTQSLDNRITAAYSLSLTLLRLKRYGEARPYALQAMRLSRDAGRYSDLSNSYNYLAQIYDGMGDYRAAYQYMRAYALIQDSLRGEKSVKVLSEVEARYKLSEKEKRIALQQLQAAQQEIGIRKRDRWLSVAGLLIILLFAYFLNRTKASRQQIKLREQQIATLEKQNELDLLNARLKGEEEERKRLARELHDGIVVLFSAIKMNLSVLPEKHSSLEDANDFRKIITRLDAATGELRKTAHNLMPDALLESGLAEAIFYFCKDIEQGSSIRVDFQQFVDIPRFKPEVELSLYRVVQELLQNIFKHANAKNVILQISHDDHLLNITIEDDGTAGVDFLKRETGNGMGLRNTRQRIATLNGLIDVNALSGRGTSVYLEFDTQEFLLK